MIRRSTVASWMVALPLIGPAFAADNDCTSGFWKNTLRCKAIALFTPGETPQPNEVDAPSDASGIKEYTRVFLSKASVRCLDGTRPLVFVDPAVCTTPSGCAQPDGTVAAYGADLISNKWIISMTGGGACNAFDEDGNGTFEDGTRCTDLYPAERNEMSSAFDAPMKNLTSEPGGSSGIMSPDPTENPVFATYNRVRIEKCSYDRYLGRATYANVSGALLGDPITYTLYNHGQRIMETALKDLKSGLTYTTWVTGVGSTATPVTATLPPLKNATHVVFIGHSGGAHGLYHNIDRLADRVRKSAVGSVDVRAIFDANFVSSIENEAAFGTDTVGGVPLGGDAFTNEWVGASVDSAGGAFTYDGHGFHEDSWFGQQQISWKIKIDKSCQKAHAASDRWKCRDRYHVLFHHVATPLFYREDFTDPNQEHTAGGDGHPIPWALPSGCTYADLLATPGCDAPRFAAATQHRDRLEEQASAFLDRRDTASEFATQADTSVAAGAMPTVYAWMPSCGSHEGAYGNAGFHETSIDGVTMRSWLESFVAAAPTNVVNWKIDGTVLTTTMTSDCPD